MPWWKLVRELRTLEARGEVRGGRFVAGFDGEQYALPEAITLLRAPFGSAGTPRQTSTRVTPFTIAACSRPSR